MLQSLDTCSLQILKHLLQVNKSLIEFKPLIRTNMLNFNLLACFKAEIQDLTECIVVTGETF